jgi:PBP1b-binding outer membrane lipoprotein LpoB
MLRAAAIALAGLFLVGCSTSAQVKNPFKSDDSQKTQLAAFAGQSQYPNKQASDDLAVTALVNKKDGTTKIINSTPQAITDAKIWINGAFVTHVDTIPARGMTTIPRENFFDRNGISMAKSSTGITKVQMETADKFYNLHGPAFEQ